MSDIHLRILRAAATSRARQLLAYRDAAAAGTGAAELTPESTQRGVELEKVSARARRELRRARARRQGPAAT